MDSGACTTIAPPSAFPNTPIHWTPKVGRVYGACGGEVVKNIGSKTVHFKTDDDKSFNTEFEIGDKITKPLIAVSHECSKGKAVFFGPGPKYESMIIEDPSALCVYSGPVTHVKLRNGTYELDMREQYSRDLNNIDGGNSSDEGGPEGDAVEHVPDGAQQPVVVDSIPDVVPISDPLVDNRVDRDRVHRDPYMEQTVSCEGPEVRVMPAPFVPSPEQVAKHNASMHLPYRSWCPICVWGRGKEKAHETHENVGNILIFECDYCFLSTKDSPEGNNGNREKLTVFVVKERRSKNIFTTVVPQKGIDPQSFAVQFFLQSIGEFGCNNVPIYVNNDQEPALKAVIEKVIAQRTAQTFKQESPVGSSQSNGSIESAVAESEAQIRTGRLAMEHNYMHRIPINHQVVPWLVRHSGFCLSRFLIGHDGQSPYQRIRGRPFKSEILEFGEAVHYKKPKNTIGPGLNKWDSRWGVGIFLGIRTVSGEQYVGTSDGTFKVRTVKRFPPDKRFNIDLMNSIKGTPWDLAGFQVPELPVELQLQPIPADSIPRVIDLESETEVRDFKIMKRNLEKHGFTEGCPGCDAAKNNTQQRPHTTDCRNRMRNAMFKDAGTKERIQAAELRLKRTRDQQGDIDMRADADGERERERLVSVQMHSCRNLIPHRKAPVKGIRLQRLPQQGLCLQVRQIEGCWRLRLSAALR